MRYIHKAEHTKGGLWPPQESCVIEGATGKAVHTERGTYTRRNTQKAVCGHRRSHVLLKGPQARRCTRNAVHTQGGTHKRRSVATTGVMLLKGPQARRYARNAVHTQGGTHKRRSMATAGVKFI